MEYGAGRAPSRGCRAAVFAPFVVALSVLACGGTGSTRDKPVGVGNQAATGASGGSGGSGGAGVTGGRNGSGGTSGSASGEAGEGTGASSSSGGNGGSGGAGGKGQASGGVGNAAGAGDTGNEAGAPMVPLGPERCSDGLDNDGDGSADCSDDECATECASVCGGVEPVDDPSTGPGSNLGHPAMAGMDCGAPADGPAVVYSVTAASTGVLEVSALGSGLLRVAVRTSCDGADAVACGLARATAPVTAGDELFVVVQGVEATDAGNFTLSVLSRALDVCGDGFRDPSESCDDGNDEPGDGCNACQLETTESGDNDTLVSADAYDDPYYGAVDPEGDVDSVGFDLATRASVIVSTENLGDGACVFGTLDSYLELFDDNGDSLGTDDDGGEGLCARIVLPNLPVGHYTAQISASVAGDTPTFPYRLLVVTDVCGNGRKTIAEECDDANVDDGDGCSATCRRE